MQEFQAAAGERACRTDVGLQRRHCGMATGDGVLGGSAQRCRGGAWRPPPPLPSLHLSQEPQEPLFSLVCVCVCVYGERVYEKRIRGRSRRSARSGAKIINKNGGCAMRVISVKSTTSVEFPRSMFALPMCNGRRGECARARAPIFPTFLTTEKRERERGVEKTPSFLPSFFRHFHCRSPIGHGRRPRPSCLLLCAASARCCNHCGR